MKNISFYVFFSNLFSYPNFHYKINLFFFLFFLKRKKNPSFYNLYFFLNKLSNNNDEIKELYLKVFDIQSISTLDIGYIYFGEDYKRAKFLISLNNEYRNLNLKCNKELVDNLSNLLILFFFCKNISFLAEFINKFFFYSLVIILNEFETSVIIEKNKFYNKYYKSFFHFDINSLELYKYFFYSLFFFFRLNFCLFKFDYLNSIFDKKKGFLKNLQKEIFVEDSN